MSLQSVIWETLGMMAFTFAVGMGVAFVMKSLVYLYFFFQKENVAAVVSDFKTRRRADNKRKHEIKKLLTLMERDTDVQLLRYIYENKDKRDAKESVDDLYDLFNFYRGIYKDNKDDDGIDDLFKYYHGKV